jgi:hypothetical protein
LLLGKAVGKLARMRYLRSAVPFILLVATFAVLECVARRWCSTTKFGQDVRRSGAGSGVLPGSGGAAVGDEDDTLYRPLLLVSFAIDATLFPDRAAVWHLVNVLLHVLATCWSAFCFCNCGCQNRRVNRPF